ncbi:hypothetical protein SDJN02_16814, partial [Cucurbita argyrosperma subsp. argyrosperma]
MERKDAEHRYSFFSDSEACNPGNTYLSLYIPFLNLQFELMEDLFKSEFIVCYRGLSNFVSFGI